MIRLGVNIDHVATVRNARGEAYPDPVQAAVFAELGGADNITCHLREDRRHIIDRDVRILKDTIKIPLNFEMAVTKEMVAIAKQVMPHAVTLVPEKREERTTEGGLDLNKSTLVESAVGELRNAGILVSLFIEPDVSTVKKAHALGVEAVEFHTGHFCKKIDQAATTKAKIACLKPLIESAKACHDLGVQVHFGHGLHYANAQWLQCVPYAEEANIGHAIVGRAILVGLESAVRSMRLLLNDPSFRPVHEI
jgi:pyridoxine 5-phosphate synthase